MFLLPVLLTVQKFLCENFQKPSNRCVGVFSLRASQNRVSCRATVCDVTSAFLLPFQKKSPSHQPSQKHQHNLSTTQGGHAGDPSPESRKAYRWALLSRKGLAPSGVRPPSALQTPHPGFSIFTITYSPSRPFTSYHVLSPLLLPLWHALVAGKIILRRKRATDGEELTGEGHKLGGIRCGAQPRQTLYCVRLFTRKADLCFNCLILFILPASSGSQPLVAAAFYSLRRSKLALSLITRWCLRLFKKKKRAYINSKALWKPGDFQL